MNNIPVTMTYFPAQLPEVVDMLLERMQYCSIITFTGPLGAGKTTLISALLQEMGVMERVTSPTFAYVNIYENIKGQHFYHFDLYRIGTLQEFKAAGFEEYLQIPQSWVFIEWPEVIEPLLKDRQVCRVTLAYAQGLEARQIFIL